MKNKNKTLFNYLHTAVYIANSYENGTQLEKLCFVDDYTSIKVQRDRMSKMGFSFIIGIISVIVAYILAIPLGTLMALKKDKLIDKLGTIYIIFIIAVPSLAYIFLFKAIGGSMGLPTRFELGDTHTWLMYILPIA